MIIYYIIIKLLIMENHPSRNQKRNFKNVFTNTYFCWLSLAWFHFNILIKG